MLSKLSRSIAGQVAIVTGAGSGMGRATAHLFADEGATVAVVDVVGDRVDHVVQEIVGDGGRAQGWTVDVSRPEEITRLVDEVAAAFGGIDIVVNNAGVSIAGPVSVPEMDFEGAWERTFAVNLTAQARLVRAALPHLRKSGAGRVVNIASTEGIIATAGIPAYTASKHGVIGPPRAWPSSSAGWA